MHFTTLLSTLCLAATATLSQPVEVGSDSQAPEIAVRGIYAAPLSNGKRNAEPYFDTPESLNKRESAPLMVGRRFSRHQEKRRRLEERHYGHHHSSSADPSATQAAADPSSTDNENCTEDGNDEGVTTIYVTIYPTDQPTDSSTSDVPAPTDAPSSSDSSATPTDSSSAPAPSSSNGTNAPQTSSGAVIQADGSPCGQPGGSPDPSPTGGPNGDENWLNCGVDGNGWVPPPVYLSNLIYRDLSEVLQENGNPFAACQPYLSMFQTMADETGVPTIFLASIALQESGCNPAANGGAGEIGMMQITPEKCPTDGTDCHDAMTNIRIGAEYFKTVLDSNNGNLAQTMGNYNGWSTGLTVASANNYAICAQHNNLDYLQNVFNGYLQGVDPSSLNMGIYHNTC